MRIVTAGLEAGERVIVKGLQRVKPGQKVEAEVAQFDPAKIEATATSTSAVAKPLPCPSAQPRSRER